MPKQDAINVRGTKTKASCDKRRTASASLMDCRDARSDSVLALRLSDSLMSNSRRSICYDM